MDKKKRNKIILMLTCALLLVTLSGCQPGHYTEKHRKELDKLHKNDAKAWFETNMPGAKCSAGSIFADGIDLMQAVRGTYTVNKETKEYIYDYAAGTMYLAGLYDEVCSLISEKQSRLLGVSPDMAETGFFGYEVIFETDNDNIDPRKYDPDEWAQVQRSIAALPWGIEPAEFADQVLQGSAELDYYTQCYVEAIPPYDGELLSACPAMRSVSFMIPADLDFTGIYGATYRIDGATFYNARLMKLSDGFTGGYVWTETRAAENGALGEAVSQLKESAFDPVFTGEGDGTFSLQVPLGARPVIFTDEKGTLFQIFTKSNGETSEGEADELLGYESGYFKGFSWYSVPSSEKLLLPGSMKGFTTEQGTSAAGGLYHFRFGDKKK